MRAALSALLALSSALSADGLRIGTASRIQRPRVAASPACGLFDGILKAFDNAEFDDRNAKAQHILLKGGDVDTRTAAAQTILEEIESGKTTFEAAAKQYSECPSRAETPSGSLGQFSPGKMVQEFDDYIFDKTNEVGAIGLVETKFGTHLVKINERKDKLDPSVQRVDGSPLF